MTADAVLEVIATLEEASVRVWLDGGWGVDALLGEQTRNHADLDLNASNVVIVGLDTVRADHLGAYGSKTVKTPHLDAFANEAILFERCGAPSTFTLPSFASLFTGRLRFARSGSTDIGSGRDGRIVRSNPSWFVPERSTTDAAMRSRTVRS